MVTATNKILRQSITPPIDQPSKALAVLFNLYASRESIYTDSDMGVYICNDLAQLEASNIITDNAYKLATNHIRDLLQPKITITGWILLNHPELYDTVIDAKYNLSDEWYNYKMAWIQDMISFWQEQGL